MTSNISIALFQPEIPQNSGTILRMAACFGMDVHIIGPIGFSFHAPQFKRSAMDYINHVKYYKYADFDEFHTFVTLEQKRLVLATTKTANSYRSFDFARGDIIMFGSEGGGVPDDVHNQIKHKICIPMVANTNIRSLNLAISCAIITSHALGKIETLQP